MNFNNIYKKLKPVKAFSRIISGTMTWGEWGSKFSKNEMQSLLEETVDLGINTFDHADIYGGYTTEATFGSAFKSSSVKRDEVFFYFQMWNSNAL